LAGAVQRSEDAVVHPCDFAARPSCGGRSDSATAAD